MKGRFCKRALSKRRYSAKETYNFIDPTDHSHHVTRGSFDIHIHRHKTQTQAQAPGHVGSLLFIGDVGSLLFVATNPHHLVGSIEYWEACYLLAL